MLKTNGKDRREPPFSFFCIIGLGVCVNFIFQINGIVGFTGLIFFLSYIE